MNIRPATLADLPQMLANAQTFISATPYKDVAFDSASMEAEFLRMIEDGLCIVAEVDGIHLGGVGAIKGSFFFNSGVHIANERFWWVVPDARASGVGKALMSAIHLAAKSAGCDYLLMLSLANEVGELYKKLGFTEAEHLFIKRL